MQNSNMYSSYAETWNRLVYYGLQATLVVYLINQIGLSKDQAYQLYATYSALTLGFAIVGGMVADRILGFYYSVVIGSLLMMVGNIAFCFKGLTAVYFGISAISLGVGLFKPNNSNLYAEIGENQSGLNAQNFSTFYMFLNIGSLIGPIAFGVTGKAFQISNIISALGIFSGIVLLHYSSYKKQFCAGSKMNFNFITKLIFIFLIAALMVIISYIIRSPGLVQIILMQLVLLNVFWFIKIFWNADSNERANMLLLLIPITSSIIFLVALLQIYTSILTYVNTFVYKRVFDFTIPSPWFGSLEPLFLIVMTSVIVKLWHYLNNKKLFLTDIKKILFGLFFTTISFLILFLSTWMQNDWQLLTIVLANFVLGIAELCVIPFSIAAINTFSPAHSKASMMAIYYSSLAVSGYLAGYLPMLTSFTHLQGIHSYRFIFLLISFSVFLFLLIMTTMEWAFSKYSNSYL